jgi:hypothetical protein
VRIKLEAGEYKVVISADNFKEFSQMAQVKAGAVTTLKAGLTRISAIGTVGSASISSTIPVPQPTAATDPAPLPTGKLSVQAIDPTSARILPGIAGATLVVANGQGQQVAKGLTDANGLFEVKLTQGEYKVTITADSYQAHSETTNLVANQVTSIKAELQKAITTN